MLLHTEVFTHSTRKLCTHRKNRNFTSVFGDRLHFVRKGRNGNPEIAILPQFLTIEPRFVRKGCAGRLELALLPQFLTIEPHFVRKGCAGQVEIAILPHSFWRSNLISCERVARDDLGIALLPQFLAIEPRFVRKGCAGHLQIAILLQFLAIEPRFVRNGCAGQVEIAILLQFLAIEPRFVRKGCVSCRLVGTAPAPAFRREIEKKERARGQEGNRRRCEDVKM